MAREILVDGYNVIKNNAMFQALEIRNLAAARDILIRQLKNRYRHSDYRVTVVFDGDGDREVVSHEDHICIIFSKHNESADTVILRLAAQARLAEQEVEMYSDDEEVRQGVTMQGGNVSTTRHLTRQLNAAPRDVELRARHRIAARRIYGIDPMSKILDDELKPSELHGKKHKKSSRRHGKRN